MSLENNYYDIISMSYLFLSCTEPQINEKIDLEIATQRYVERLGNTQEKLLELKAIIQVLNQYYVMFLRDK